MAVWSSWRLVVSEPADSFANMAVEESVMEHVSMGLSPPTLRFFRWSVPAVVIGAQQRVHEVVDVELCREKGIQICRRMSGGGAVFKDPEGELNYSLVVPRGVPPLPDDDLAIHPLMVGILVEGFARLGVAASFSGTNDVVVGGKKISGNAQSVRKGVLLYHGTILLKVDRERMFEPLRVPQEKSERHGLKDPKLRVTSLEECLGRVPPLEEVVEAFSSAFSAFFGFPFERGSLSDPERERAKELYCKYSDEGWIFSLP